jgi:serine/threonine protein kinase
MSLSSPLVKLRRQSSSERLLGSFNRARKSIFSPTAVTSSISAASLSLLLPDLAISDADPFNYRIGTSQQAVGVTLFGEIVPCFSLDSAFKEEPCVCVATAKTILKSSLFTADDHRRVCNDIQIAHQLSSHPAILKLLEVHDSVDALHCIYEQFHECVDLFTHINAQAPVPEDGVKLIFVQIVDCLSYLHSEGIVHRDIKPDNFLIGASGGSIQVKLCDFSLATRLQTESDTIFSPYNIAGTPGYVAPEVLRGDYYAFKVDMFSAGVILYTLLGGFPPFDISEETTQYNPHVYTAPFFDGVSWEGRKLMDGLLEDNPGKRLSAKECRVLKWFDGVKSVGENGEIEIEGQGKRKEELELETINARSSSEKTGSDEGRPEPRTRSPTPEAMDRTAFAQRLMIPG